MKTLEQIATSLENDLECTCDRHDWIPHRLSGHVEKCGVHQCALAIYRAKPQKKEVRRVRM